MGSRSSWFSSNRMLGTVRLLGENLYEREVLRMIFEKYIAAFYKNRWLPHTLVELKYSEFNSVMGRNSYLNALKALKQRGIIHCEAKKGKPGGHTINIITEPIVNSIISRGTCIEEILGK